jgi:hypothetical protein
VHLAHPDPGRNLRLGEIVHESEPEDCPISRREQGQERGEIASGLDLRNIVTACGQIDRLVD